MFQGVSKKERRRQRLVKSPLLNQANSFISRALKLRNLSPNHTVDLLVNEMVHSILFSGHILDLKIEPEEMLKAELLELVNKFGTALEGFKNKLPRRSPFSCLLELIVEVKGKENRNEVMEELSEITKELDCRAHNQLIGTAVCITHSSGSQQIFSYGASIPKAEERYKDIWIALSCVHTWHPRVSYAVMQCSRGEPRNVPFSNLEALESSCTAYDAKTSKDMEPCARCCELFSLEPVNQKPSQHPYGNCAEAEAISELFRLRRVTLFETHTLLQWTNLRDVTQKDLIRRLREVKCNGFNADVVYEPTSTQM